MCYLDGLRTWGIEESLVDEQIDKAFRKLDMAIFLIIRVVKPKTREGGERVPFVHTIQHSMDWGKRQGNSSLCSAIRRSIGRCFLGHL